MARSRNIKPGFFHNEDLVELPYEYRLLFIGLWCMADREGRLENRPKKIKMQIFPADDLDVSRAILGLSESRLITLYSVDNIEYIQIDNFLKHQHPHHKEAKSVIPPLNTEGSPVKVSADPADSLLPITDSLLPITDSLNNTGKEKKSSKPKRFVKPTLDQIKEYCLERKNNIDPENFFDSNEAKGWVVGKNKTPMKNWQAAIRTWEKQNFNNGSQPPQNLPTC